MQLEKLRMASCSSVTSLQPLGSLGSSLRELDLSYCVAVQNLEGLQNCVGLRTLSLQGCPSVSDISALRGCTQLRDLDLSFCGEVWYGEGSKLTSLDPISGCSSLERLDIS
jgi:Leucine-rich repeat (LRR) protein